MRSKSFVFVLLFGVFFLFLASPVIYAADYPKEPVAIKLDGRKNAHRQLPPLGPRGQGQGRVREMPPQGC